jgi:Catalase
VPRTDAADTAAHPTEAARDLIGRLVHCSETNGRSPTGGATVLGIDFTNDLVLQIRNLSYSDTQLIRLGGENFGHCRCQSTEL